MGKIYKISQKEMQEIKEIRKRIKDKNADRRFHAVQLRGEGYSNTEIANRLETTSKVVSLWISAYAKGGIEALYSKKWTIVNKLDTKRRKELRVK